MFSPCLQAFAFFHPELNKVSLTIDGSDIEADRIALSKDKDGNWTMQVAVAGKKFEISKAGRRELPSTQPKPSVEQVRADIQRYFDAEEGCD